MRRTHLYSFGLLSVFFCGTDQRQQQWEEVNRLRSQVYFTKEDPGRWKDFSADHVPTIKTQANGKIEIDVPLQTETGHYIEAIVLSDAAGRELAVRYFERAQKPHASLQVSPEKIPGATVFAKCNLHGMWRAQIK